MRFLIAILLAFLVTGAAIAGTETCLLKGEKIDGLNKMCTYSCPSGNAVTTIKSYQLCPQTWKR